jgi:hypothetical protein
MTTFYKELGDKTPDSEIIAEYGAAGKYNLFTSLSLKGNGIKFREKENGINRYLSTENALKELSKTHSVAHSLYLD